MSGQDFSSLPLHDALLSSVELLWKQKLCRLHLYAFGEKGDRSRIPLASTNTPSFKCKPSPVEIQEGRHLLEFQQVTALKIPHDEPWGRSSSVNEISHSSGTFQIEMQSGDIIEIAAGSFTLVAL